MVLLTCDSDINLALMSSSANEVIEARVQRQQRRQRRGGGVSAHDTTYQPITYELFNTAATDAVAAATDAGSQLTRLLR